MSEQPLDDLLDTARSLLTIMREETEQLGSVGRYPDHAVMTQAKVRLTGMLDAELTRLNRVAPGWLDTADADLHAALVETFAQLKVEAETNAAVVQRQLDLSNELIAVVTREAKRLTGRRRVSYHPSGAVSETATSAPISINTAL